MGALLALVSSVAWGCADFAGGLGARRLSGWRVVAVSYPAGGLILLIFSLTLVPGEITAEVLWLSAFTALVGITGMLLLYAALAAGPMGIVSPLTAVGGAVVPVIVGIARGEQVTALFLVGVILALVAVVLVSRESGPHARATPRALLLSAGAGVAIGFYLTALGIAPESSGIWVATFSRWIATVGIVGFALVVLLRNGKASWLPYPWLLALGAGVLDASANGLFQLAAQSGELAVVAVIGSLYPAATLLLAHYVLKERMSIVQWSGVGLALGAVVALTI